MVARGSFATCVAGAIGAADATWRLPQLASREQPESLVRPGSRRLCWKPASSRAAEGAAVVAEEFAGELVDAALVVVGAVVAMEEFVDVEFAAAVVAFDVAEVLVEAGVVFAVDVAVLGVVNTLEELVVVEFVAPVVGVFDVAGVSLDVVAAPVVVEFAFDELDEDAAGARSSSRSLKSPGQAWPYSHWTCALSFPDQSLR